MAIIVTGNLSGVYEAAIPFYKFIYTCPHCGIEYRKNYYNPEQVERGPVTCSSYNCKGSFEVS